MGAHELIVIYGSVENTHGHLGCCLKYRRNHRSYSDELELPIKKNQEALKLLHELRYQLLRCSASRTMSIKVAEVKTREGLTLPTNSSFLWTMSQSRNSSIVPRSLESSRDHPPMNTVNKKQRKSGHIFCWWNPLEVERIDWCCTVDTKSPWKVSFSTYVTKTKSYEIYFQLLWKLFFYNHQIRSKKSDSLNATFVDFFPPWCILSSF